MSLNAWLFASLVLISSFFCLSFTCTVTTSYPMVLWTLFEVNEQLCALVPGWVTAIVRVLLLVVVHIVQFSFLSSCSCELGQILYITFCGVFLEMKRNGLYQAKQVRKEVWFSSVQSIFQLQEYNSLGALSQIWETLQTRLREYIWGWKARVCPKICLFEKKRSI